MSKSYIEYLFQEYNQKYFDGKLYPMPVYWAEEHISEWGYCCNDYIMLSPILKKYHLALSGILIHEMIHAYLQEDDHTRIFTYFQNKINKKHFGAKGNHTLHFNNMLKDLTKKKRYDILNYT